jgi:lipopolysaccharide export system protein LptA
VTIEILGADELIYDETKKDAQFLKGNVRIKHENTLMFCDSALVFAKTNRMNAYGHIHVKQGDTVNIYGDSIVFDGNKKLAQMRGNIRMVEKDLRLETDSLDYHTGDGVAYYTAGAVITSVKNNNVLTSRKGYYYSKSKEFFFRDSVRLVHPEYEISCDTLKYLPVKEMAVFQGPTVIRTKESVLYCESGWYDTRKDQSLFSGNAFFHSREHIMRGDTIFYDRINGIGLALGNFELTDTLNDVILRGNYGKFKEETSEVFVTGKALMIRIFEKDSLYMHADTMQSITDTLDEEKKILLAFHDVRFFKTDLQGKCDSLVFDGRDSTLKLFYNPVIWHEENQLSADYAEIVMSGNTVKNFTLTNNCFIISAADTVGFNQIKGKKMTGSFSGDKLTKVIVTGNGQTIYYAGEEGKEYIGMNKAECSDIIIYLDGKEISKIAFLDKPAAVLYPMDKINPKDQFLENFKWQPELRPEGPEDLFE